jgi:hypothetical protein
VQVCICHNAHWRVLTDVPQEDTLVQAHTHNRHLNAAWSKQQRYGS